MCDYDVLVYLFLYLAIFKLNVCWVDFWCKVQCKVSTPVNVVVATQYFDPLVFDSAVMPNYPLEFCVNNVIWTFNGFSLMSPFIEVFFTNLHAVTSPRDFKYVISGE